ncbi:MAG: 3-phosphoglycerate dehydrogenase [Lachnospiraceae bacterium]|nr:3-phosphoglycerate dehydrogenase [Lachnospiraceae bacterium]MBQ9563783.1 3-phosphoglycerate dehydrogenase [Lachnospiraceae bacterium]MBQ9592984.1 3-phosphoglycerate dehydrogenase [Lachnospiraceae bacterium]MBR0153326.1 3-phosphoglycerate dehydrogenase [Lachnospiraceae bacterium]
MYHIHCLNKISQVGLEHLTGAYALTDEIESADGILVRSAQMHEMDFGKRVAAIARAGAGVNNIPLDRCAEEGIVVFNTPGANANGVKEAVLAGLFLSSRDYFGGATWVQTEREDPNVAKVVEKKKSAFAGCEIKGKKLGVIGLGAIGVLVANDAVKLGMKVYGCDPYLSLERAWQISHNVNLVKSNEEIYRDCDYITIHVPALPSTKGMIGREQLAMMKDGVVVLNFARDVLVDDDAMAEALACGKVKKYVTDFPNPKSVAMDNCLAIPHLGASTEESEENCAEMAVKELREYLENGNILNSVNYPDCQAGISVTGARIAVLHRNVPNVISGLTTVLGSFDINIEHMTNTSRGNYAYSLFDYVPNPAVSAEELKEKMEALDNVLRVRII